MTKFLFVIAVSLVFLVTGDQALKVRPIELSRLTGNIRLTLKHGVGKLWEGKPVYQDITIDLVCDRGDCQREVWGYAPKFNQEVDHKGVVEVISTDNGWQLKIKLNILPHPWHNQQKPANYNIDLILDRDQLLGNYQGNYNELSLQGKVIGAIAPRWPVKVVNAEPMQPQEHPRLVFRKNQLPRLRSIAKTPEGKAILAQLQKTLSGKIYYHAYVPNAGYHAAGYCFLSLLNENPQPAQTAWQLVVNSIANPNSRLLEQSATVAGVALAYDLCYERWNQTQRNRVKGWLNAQADQLLKGDTPRNGWNSNAASNWNARARAAAGLAALAILEQSSQEDETITDYQSPLNQAKIAERNIKRYLTAAIGNRGFGSEGDHYTTEPLVLTVIPFLLAYRTVMGQDLIENSQAEWFLPHYLMRIVPDGKNLSMATYGRHRHYAGGSLFAMGLNIVPKKFLPGVMWLFNRSWGMEGDRTFGINNPSEGIYAFVGYRRNIIPENPEKILDRVLVDEQKGFFVFRNQWHNQDDFVASIYAKSNPVAGWSFPDVGSFRLSGLGGNWAIAGPSEGKWDDENVVVIPKIRAWNKSIPFVFQSHLDGSGVVSLATDKIVVNKNKPPSAEGVPHPIELQLLRSFAVDYSGAAGVPGLFVVVDQFIGTGEDEHFKNKTWVMHTAGQVVIEGQSFTIQNSKGATMRGTFITPERVKISVQPTTSGQKIMATGGENFFVVMTVQRGNIPNVEVKGTGLDALVKVGKQQIYFLDNKIVLGKF